MQLLSQRDSRWAFVKIGASQLALGRWGCTTTCLSMISDRFGRFLAPDVIAKQRTWYTPAGLVWWKMLQIPGMQFEKRLYSRSDADILKSLNDPNKAVMLEVNHGQHWIVAMRKTWFKNDYICADPWTGKTCAAIGDYKNITGSAHFSKT